MPQENTFQYSSHTGPVIPPTALSRDRSTQHHVIPPPLLYPSSLMHRFLDPSLPNTNLAPAHSYPTTSFPFSVPYPLLSEPLAGTALRQSGVPHVSSTLPYLTLNEFDTPDESRYSGIHPVDAWAARFAKGLSLTHFREYEVATTQGAPHGTRTQSDDIYFTLGMLSPAVLCPVCGKLVGSEEARIPFGGRVYHEYCFVCFECQLPLFKNYLEKDAKPICEKCYRTWHMVSETNEP